MGRRRGGSARSAVAFVALTLASLATFAWSLLDESGSRLVARSATQVDAGSTGGARAPFAGAHPPRSPRAAATDPTLLRIDTLGAALALRAAPEGASPLTVVRGGVRLEGGAALGEPVRLLPTGEEGPWALALAPGARWSIEVAGGAERLELELAELELASLRVEPPTGALEGTLPRAGRSEVALGAGRTALRLVEGSDADLRLMLGFGPLALSAEPGSRGRIELVPGFGPATITVDAGVRVALELPPGEPPPLALQGTWWRHQDRGDSGSVTWVRGPAAASPESADLKLVVTAPLRAPLAVTYR